MFAYRIPDSRLGRHDAVLVRLTGRKRRRKEEEEEKKEEDRRGIRIKAWRWRGEKREVKKREREKRVK